ncbi:phage tail tape measure protein [Verrucomicrobia bacterium]|nr:phage tail tape measure protein [Verrucomicrobiota bacterium]
MAASNARVIAFGASTAVLGSAVAGFRSLARASIEVEKNLADVNRILQLTTSDLQMFGKELFNISKRTATSFNDASKALLEFSRQGLDASETLKRTNDALTLTRLAGLGAEASVAALTATVNGFSKSGITTTQVLNKLVAVEQSFAVSARDLSQGLARTGQAAQEAGVDIDQLNALISAAQQKTARGGAVIGNALKTIFTRLQRSDTLDRLEEFNVAVRDVQGNTLPAALILQNFAASYDKLADAQRAQLSEQVAGVYQVNILKAIISDLNSEQSIYNGALAKGSQATNEAARANAQLNQILSALLVQTGNNAQQLASTIGSVTFDPLAKSAAKAANSILETFTGLLTGEGLASDFANGLLKGIRNVLGGPGAVAAFYTLFKLVQNSFTYVAQALPQLAGITTETQKRQSLEQAILGILQQENAVSKALVGTTGNQKRQAEILLGVAKQQTAEYQKQKTIASGLAATLRTQGVSVGSRGLQTGKTRSGGFIPNATKQAERSGALAGGYMPGKVINSPVGGVMNTAEQVKYVPGFAQPFINPPKTSRAGRLHRVESLRQTGVNPYMHEGFVPNFAKTNHFQRGRDFEKVVGDFIKVPPKYNAPIDYEKVKSGVLKKLSPTLMFNKGVYGGGTYADAHVGLGHTAAQIISKIINHSDQEGDLRKILRKKNNKGAFSVKNNLVEIIGKGSDKSVTKRSAYESLNVTAKGSLKKVRSLKELQGSKFHASFEKDKVNIPNFAAAYKDIFTGKLNNSAIARGLKSGALSGSEAAAMGYTTSGSKIDARKAKRASFVNSLNYKQVYVPWDIEAFRAKGSAAKGQTFNQTQGSTYEKYILNSLRSGIKGTTSLGAPFALPARPDAINGNLLKGKINSRIDGYSLSAGEMYEMKSGDKGDTLAGLQNKFIEGLKNNPEILNPKRKWKNYIFRTTRAKGRGASNGFIPNLAYKGEVMDLEESISGEKAIYSNTPFPHVRNASQPTFASAIADHGGLSNALKDSYGNQSAAGMVYGGFVPNFADNDRAGVSIGKLNLEKLQTQVGNTTKNLIDLSDEFQLAEMFASDIAKDLKSGSIGTETAKKKITELGKNLGMTNKQTKQLEKNIRKASKNSSGFKLGAGAGTALAFAGPMAAGLLEQTFFGDRQRSDMSGGERMAQSGLSTGLTSVSTGIAIGDSLGIPFGGLLGGIAGAGLGVVSAFNAASLSAEELAEANAKSLQLKQADIAAANSYIQAQRQLSSLTSSNASRTEIENATKKLATNFDQIKDTKLQDIFLETGGNVELMTKRLSEYTALVSRRGAAEAFLSSDFSRPSEQLGSQLSIASSGINSKEVSAFLQGLSPLVKLAEMSDDANLQTLGANPLTGGSGTTSKQRTAATERQKILDSLRYDDFMGINRTQFTEGQDSSDQFEAIAKRTAEFLGLSKETSVLFDDIVKSFSKSLANGLDLKTIIENFEKQTKKKDLASVVGDFRSVAETTFNAIFRDLTEDFSKIDSEAKAAFQVASSNNRIESAIIGALDSINDQMSSFIIKNVPDFQKYQLQGENASRVATAALEKSNRDFRVFDLKQNNDRGEFLRKNTSEITKIFKENLSQSVVTAEAFEKLLPSVKSGSYDVDVQSVLDEGRKSALTQASTSVGKVYGFLNSMPGVSGYTERFKVAESELSTVDGVGKAINGLNNMYQILESGSEITKDVENAFKDLATAQDVLQAYTNSEAKTKIENALDERKRALDNFDLFQKTAREETEVAKAVADEKIRLDRLIATEKAKSDAKILETQRRINEQVSKSQYQVGLDNISSQRSIAAIDRSLSDPRQNFGLGVSGRRERIVGLEDERIRLQREVEDRILQQEITQSQLEIISRAKNTEALMQLNETVADQYKKELEAEGAGGKVAQEIANYRMAGAPEADIAKMVGQENYAREMSYSENNARIANMQTVRNLGRTKPGEALTDKEINEQFKQAKQMPGIMGDQVIQQERLNDLKIKQRDATRENADEQRDLNREIESERGSLAGSFKYGVGQMRNESDKILLNLAETAPSRFADGMANALSQVAEGSKSLGDAFTDMAIDFGRMLQQEVFRALAQKAVGSALSGGLGFLGGSQKGGIIKAQNGMYISGGRTGDRNLAMLEDGEYVLNRNAVRMMGGPKSLDSLNYSMAPRFNRGGGFSMSPSLGSDGKFGGDLLLNNRNIGGINSDMFTAYAYENSPYFQGMREDAKKALQRRIQKRFEKKQKRAQLVSSVVGAVGSMFMSAGMSGMAASNPAPTGTRSVMNFDGTMSSVAPGSPTYLSRYASAPAPGFFKRNFLPRNSGGFIPHGSRLSDTIPAMLTGGEYVMNNKAVRKYGLGTMNAINSGSAQGSGASNSNTTNTSTNNNSTNISVSVDRSGNAVYGSNTSSHEQQDIVISKQMAKEISGIVMKNISNEKRYGGALYRS